MNSSLPTTLIDLLRSLPARAAALRRSREDRQLLLDMGAAELRDLGIGRDQIAYLTAPTMPGRWAE